MTDGPDITAPEDRAGRRQRRPPASSGNGEPATAPRPRLPRRVLVTCPDCGARFRTAVAAAARTTECMACAGDVPVPGRAELLRALEKPRGRRRDDSDAELGADDDERPRRRKRRRGIDPWGTFFDGVFSFPWHEGVFSRWLLLSFGCCIVGLTSVMMLHFVFLGLYFGVWAMRMAWGWSCIFTFGYASACSLPIITETAAGSDRVEGWPEPYWKDWAVDLARVAMTGLAAAALAFGGAKVFELWTGWFWVPMFVGLYVLFPICLLSSMHADSILVPVTPAILQSLVDCWWAWLTFYVAVAAVSLVWPGMMILGFAFNPWLTAIATAPLMGAALFIYARLLGRLGRVIASCQA